MKAKQKKLKDFVEIFRVSPAYRKISKKRKIRVLELLIKWANNELKNI